MAGINKVKRNKIVIELDKEREVKFTLEAMGMLEDKYGSVDAALAQVEAGRIRDVIYLLFAALCHEDEELTEKSLGKLVDARDLPYIVETLTGAMNVDMPEASGDKSPN